MDRLDEFAKAIVSGNLSYSCQTTPEEVAKWAFDKAEAMMRESDRRKRLFDWNKGEKDTT
jgi:hypothetical protein